MTKPEETLRTARAFVAENRPSCRVERLLEDGMDYFVQLSLNDPNGGWPLGPGRLFVTKATGELWSDAYGNVLGKIAQMHEV